MRGGCRNDPPRDRALASRSPRRRRRRRPGLLASALLVAATSMPSSLAAQLAPPPTGRWLTIRTEHFRVTFPEALEPLGRRAAERAERAWAGLASSLEEPPSAVVDLLVTDHVDLANGFTTMIPSNRITIWLHTPLDVLDLAYFDDRLEDLITHELTHAFHLDRTGPLGRVVRTLLGRYPPAWPSFPQVALPRWVIEGLATYYESALTNAGRVKGTHHEMLLRTAILEDAFEPLDRVSGESEAWPGGTRWYAYGSAFLDHLIARHGIDAADRLVDEVSDAWIPYLLDEEAEDAFGVGFSVAWREWTDSLRRATDSLVAALAAHHPITETEVIAADGREAFYARPSPDGSRLAWARADGRSDPQLRVVDLGPALSSSRTLTRLNDLGTFSWTPDGGVVFAQIEFQDRYRLYSDLWERRRDGSERRITRGARLSQPDVRADGTIVAVQSGEGTNRLVVVLPDGTIQPLTPFDPARHWAFPRWSPDGERFVVSMWTPGGTIQIMMGRPRGGLTGIGLVPLASGRAVSLAPSWSPDGRYVLWSSDGSGIANLYVRELDEEGRAGPIRQITNLLTGARFQSVDPEGRWIYFSAYHAEGWRIERIPFDPESWFDPLPILDKFSEGTFAGGGEAYAAAVDLPAEPYNPLPTLLPRFWEPELGTSTVRGGRTVFGPWIGANTQGEDLIGRHSYGARVRYDLERGSWDGRVAYNYAGLGNPILSLTGVQAWSASGPFGFRVEEEERTIFPIFVTERERRLGGAARFLLRRMRYSAGLTLGASHVWEDRGLIVDDPADLEFISLRRPEARLAEGRATLSISTVRGHALSIGPEEGVSAFVGGRIRRELDLPESEDGRDFDRGFEEGIVRLAAYEGLPLFGYADHVIALRASGGMAWGPGADAFHFDIGGAGGATESVTGFGLFGGQPLFFPVRGYDLGDRSGRYAWSATVEYRIPLVRVDRGLGLFPLHLDEVIGTAFFDAGNAWGTTDPEGSNPERDPLASAGGELIAEVLPFWTLPLRIRGGFAVPLEGREGTRWYLRLGLSF